MKPSERLWAWVQRVELFTARVMFGGILVVAVCFAWLFLTAETAPAEAETNPPEEVTEAAADDPEPLSLRYSEAAEGPELEYLGRYYVTGYDLCVECCGKTDGITASGVQAQVGRTCAAAGLPFGTELYIDGIGTRIVEDRGGGGENWLDVLCNDHAGCYALTGYYDVWVVV